jgi:YegS/Rv2252/BmrU family lipid kinase
MTSVAVIAHARKTLGAGLPAFRQRLECEVGPVELWCEVDKSRRARAQARHCVDAGADLIIVWGGDGTVQRVVDAVAGTDVTVAIMPAGTANLLATNLGVPADLEAALDIALHGARRAIDVGRVNGERFAVMAGAGLDAIMIKEADRQLKDRVGRLAYVLTGVRASGRRPVKARVDVDGRRWWRGATTCVLFGNMGTLTGGLVAFPGADPADGRLEVGVVTAASRLQWARVLTRLVLRQADRTPLTRTTRARKVDVRFSKAITYELDGGDRPPAKRLKVRLTPGAVRVAVPALPAR